MDTTVFHNNICRIIPCLLTPSSFYHDVGVSNGNKNILCVEWNTLSDHVYENFQNE
jgi:hypothetical protein